MLNRPLKPSAFVDPDTSQRIADQVAKQFPSVVRIVATDRLDHNDEPSHFYVVIMAESRDQDLVRETLTEATAKESTGFAYINFRTVKEDAKCSA